MLTLRPSSLVPGAVLIGLGLTALPLSSALQDADPPSGLRPILPPDTEQTQEPAPAAPFDAELWRSRLTDTDLERRESSFDEAAGRVAREPELEAWLEAAAERSDDLAWTARLLLREARRSSRPRAQSRPLGGNDPFQAWRSDPFGFDPFEGFEGFGAWPFGGPGSTLDAFDDLFRTPASPGSSQGLRFRMGPDGVEVEVRENVDGEERVQTYRADDLGSLLEAHPELRDRIGSGGLGQGLGQGLGPRGQGPLQTGAPRVLRTDILGVRVAPTDPGRGEPEGLRVFDTELGTVAQLLGVGRGDVLLELNGRPLRAVADISEVLANRPEGGELRLRWFDRNGVETTRVWRPGSPETIR